ncbi:very short patch repair endonuclease [Pseudoflavonifractor sp. 524-17]|uniref:very short patch repair endonuclease n=1 Tax=Pseudoflavonifractor sp. 524-17 TaxID=2304577 RepID=UPI00325BD6B6
MAGDYRKSQRSYNMLRIWGTNTSPEERVRKYLFSKGFRYRKNVRKLPGCPDIVLPKYKTVIFVNGCFWHKHSYKRFVWPSSNQEYWYNKINGNALRDEKNRSLLEADGWNVVVVWECELKKQAFDDTMEKLISSIQIPSIAST